MTGAESKMPIELLRQLVECDQNGNLTWLPRTKETHSGRDVHRWNTRYAGKPALTARCTKGYFTGSIHSMRFFAHRVVWALHHGAWPSMFIDHINGKAADNRIENLRDVSNSENARNAKTYSTNTSGRTGVHYQTALRKYAAYIRVADRKMHLGFYDNLDDAIAARVTAERAHGFHENHGRAR